MKVTLIGHGFLGRHVTAQLAEASIVALSRTGAWRGPPLGHVVLRRCDVTQCSTDELAEHVQPDAPLIVCHAAGRSQDASRLYVDGARLIANACERARPSRVVYTSSTSALPNVSEPVDETETRWPEFPRGRVQRQAEEALREGLARIHIPLAILRLGGLYGPGRDLRRLYLKDPAATIAGDGMEATNLIHVEDAAAAVVAAVTRASAYDGLVHVCDGDHTPRRMMIQRVCNAAGSPAPPFALPAPTSGATRGKRVVSERLGPVLGVELRHPHRDFRLDPD